MLATGADVTAHAVQLLAFAAAALLLHAAGRRFFSPAAGLWAAALWLAHPLAHYQAASAYVDLVLALFCLLAVVAWEAWREGRLAGVARSGGWLALSGAAGGFAAATKYLGLLWLGVLGLVGLAAAPRGRRLAPATVVGLVALAVAGPWYVRIHHHTGNPVHPLLGSLLGGGEEGSRYDHVIGIAGEPGTGDGAAGLARGAARALARPAELPRFAWRATFDRRWFSRQSPLAPWHLVLVPLAAAFALRDRRLLRWLLLVAVYALLWTTHDPRFQLPSLALLALAGGGALHHLGERLPAIGRWLARPAAVWALAVVLALPGPAYAVYKLARHGPLPPVTPAAREAYLDREVPAYAAVRLLNERHGADYTVFVLHGQDLTYYADGRLLGHLLGPWSQDRVLPLVGDPAALHRELHTMGVDYLLAVHARLPVPFRRDGDFRRLFEPVASEERWELLAVESTP
jgi:4-amino-4-deoxy-L-arabinose transferase-like glycosyltransferase